MIDALQNDELIVQFGGRFKLCRLIQRRWLQLLQGARPMVSPEGLSELEVVVQEIVEGKIEMEFPDDAEHEDDAVE